MVLARLLLPIVLAVLAPARLAAQVPPVLEVEAEATVGEIIDGDTVLLADGRQVRLVGIQAPKLPLGRAGFKAWPLAEEAKAALAALVAGKTVTLAHGGARLDRHGRVLAQLYLPDGAWVEGLMLRAGLARVYTFPDNRALAAEMLAIESEARNAGRGIWAEPYYAVRAPEDVGADLDSFQVVEGTVIEASVVGGRGYLNFGPDWRTDFTLSLDSRALKLFKQAGVAVESFAGKRVRVRGWIDSFNGAMIEITHPEQIEVLP